jgi:hypothetical protein
MIFQEGVGLPDIKINQLKNRLYIFLQDGLPTKMPAFVRKLESACLALIPGFTCLAFIPPGGLERRCDRDLFSNATDLATVYGARKVVCLRGAGEQSGDRPVPRPRSLSLRRPVKQIDDPLT